MQIKKLDATVAKQIDKPVEDQIMNTDILTLFMWSAHSSNGKVRKLIN